MPEPIVAIISPGNMGAAIGARLVAGGVRVVTPTGRSAESERRARDAGIALVDEAELATADFLFSVVPPAFAVLTAERLAPLLAAAGKPPLYIDWNAISPEKTKTIEAIIVSQGVRFADGSIIGLPPKDGNAGPVLYASGEAAMELRALDERGIRFRPMDAPVGAASALKMSYAGITKGVTALGTAMFLAADRAGCAEALIEEMSASQPQMLASFRRSIPDMFSKAKRWVPELEEIAAFVGSDRVESGIYDKISATYAYLSSGSASVAREKEILKETLK